MIQGNGLIYIARSLPDCVYLCKEFSCLKNWFFTRPLFICEGATAVHSDVWFGLSPKPYLGLRLGCSPWLLLPRYTDVYCATANLLLYPIWVVWRTLGSFLLEEHYTPPPSRGRSISAGSFTTTSEWADIITRCKDFQEYGQRILYLWMAKCANTREVSLWDDATTLQCYHLEIPPLPAIVNIRGGRILTL